MLRGHCWQSSDYFSLEESEWSAAAVSRGKKDDSSSWRVTTKTTRVTHRVLTSHEQLTMKAKPWHLQLRLRLVVFRRPERLYMPEDRLRACSPWHWTVRIPATSITDCFLASCIWHPRTSRPILKVLVRSNSRYVSRDGCLSMMSQRQPFEESFSYFVIGWPLDHSKIFRRIEMRRSHLARN